MTITRREFAVAGLGALSVGVLGGDRALAGSDELLRKAIPSTGELVPVIGLGTNRYGAGDDAAKRAALRAALERFHALGGTVIDTAPMYRTSESVLGDLIADLGIRDRLFIATKADRSVACAPRRSI
jgi:aryl-alcohol dehydrogenase-like predicted oxidoreductase